MSGLNREESDALKWVVLTFTILFWGLAFTAIKYAVRFLNPFELAFMRFLVADTLYAITVVVRGYRIEKSDIPALFILGFFGVTAYHVCLNAGEIYIQSGTASLIISTSPVFVLILSAIFLRERITPRKVLGILIAISGVYILSKPESSGSIIGILLVLLSTVSAGIYTVMGKIMLEKYSPGVLTSYVMLLGSIPLLPFAPSSFEKIWTLDSFTVISVIFLGVFSTYFSYQGWYYFLKRESASKASVFLNAIPLVSILAGFFLLSENITFETVAGGLLVITGILIVMRAKG